MDEQRQYSTGQIAEAAGVGPETLRYYELQGLLPEAPRSELSTQCELSLQRLRRACDRAEPTSSCPILDALKESDA